MMSEGGQKCNRKEKRNSVRQTSQPPHVWCAPKGPQLVHLFALLCFASLPPSLPPFLPSFPPSFCVSMKQHHTTEQHGPNMGIALDNTPLILRKQGNEEKKGLTHFIPSTPPRALVDIKNGIMVANLAFTFFHLQQKARDEHR